MYNINVYRNLKTTCIYKYVTFIHARTYAVLHNYISINMKANCYVVLYNLYNVIQLVLPTNLQCNSSEFGTFIYTDIMISVILWINLGMRESELRVKL